MPLQEGDRIGTYEIIGQVGQGGMATVYKAHHERLDRFVALKLMHETFLQEEGFRARFQREARIVARLEHPGIVPVYDYHEHENIPYLVMKFVSGQTLKRHALKNGVTPQRAHELLSRVADALDYAHRQGVLHRDMKPSNILIDSDGNPYISDFGLARIAEAGASTISHDMMLGTPFYISPEQAQGQRDLDSRTDIYSLGVILYELLAGRVPFHADTPYAIVHGHIYQQPEPPSTYNPALSPAVDAVLMKALSKEPGKRHATATAMLEAFGQALRSGEQPTPQRNFDDLGDEFTQLKHKQPDVVSSPLTFKRKGEGGRTIEAQLDLGNVDWSEIGERFRTRVTGFAEMIEERIDTELRQRRGIGLTEEEIIRQRVKERLEKRQEFVQHIGVYIAVNSMLFFIWLFSGAGFFWPMFPLFFWGMGLASQGVEYYAKYGPGAAQNRAKLEEEVRREMERSMSKRKPKEKPEHSRERIALDDLQDGQGARIRLNEDGELTDSFIEEKQRRKR